MTEEERAAAARLLAGGRPRIVKACEVCGNSFETYATGKVGRYCSGACRQKGYRRENLSREQERQREQKRRQRRPRPRSAEEGHDA